MGVCASDSSWHSLLFLLFQLSVGKNKLLIYRLQIFFRRASLPGEVIQMGYIEESLSDQTVGRGCSNHGLSLTRTYASARTHRAVFSNWNPVPVSQLTQVQRTRSLSLHNMEMPLSVLFWHNVGSAGQATVCLTTPIRSRHQTAQVTWSWDARGSAQSSRCRVSKRLSGFCVSAYVYPSYTPVHV